MWAVIHLLFIDKTGVWRTFYSYKIDKKKRSNSEFKLYKRFNRKKSWGHDLSKFESTIYHESNVKFDYYRLFGSGEDFKIFTLF